MSNLRTSLTLAALAASLAALACGNKKDDPTGPSPAVPTTVTTVTGSGQSGVVGSVLPQPLKVLVHDQRGSPMADALVAFITHDGSVAPTYVRSDANGMATASWHLPTTPTSSALVYAALLDTASGALTDTSLFTAVVTAGPPTRLVREGYPGSAPTGTTLQSGLVVTVTDAYGNPIPGVTVSWAATGGGGSVSPATTTTSSTGTATTNATLASTAGHNTFTASAIGQTVTFTIQGYDTPTAPPRALAGSGFGIAWTGDGKLAVTLIYGGALQIIDPNVAAAPSTIQLGGTPTVVAVDGGRATAYVANMNGSLQIVSLSSGAVTKTVPIDGAHSLALSPRGDRVYVARTTGAVTVVDATSGTVITSIPVPNGPWGFAFRAAGTDSTMYVTARDGGTITEIDMKTNAVRRTFAVGGRPHGLAITPDGSTLIAAADNGEVKFVAVATGLVETAIPLVGAFGIAITPDGETAYVTTNDGYVGIVNVGARTLSTRIQTGGQPRQIVTDASGNVSYAANMSGWVDRVTR